MAAQGDTATHQPNWSYEVFLSFRGEDTRDSFTGYLYQALSRRGLKIFLDDEGLKGGDQIKRSLVNAIQQSRASIVVLSENYASSTWCLDELVEILECMRLKNQLVWPIFYKVAPSDVRHQRNSYAEAMAEQEEKFGEGSDKVQKWRSALSEVAGLKGWHYETGYKSKFIEEIVKKATTKVQREQFDVGEHIIGHQSRIEEVKSLLDIESHQSIRMLGIYGIGEMGKTTLAKALYNSIIHQFEYAIFLEDVREKSNSYMGLVRLQEAILSKFGGENIKLSSASEGVTRLKDILQHQKVLLVLDDVDKEDQLENLARKCDWFGLGSRIIITTRDKHVLDLHDVEKRFEMNGLNDDEALQLFCLKAFKESQPPINYEKVSKRVVQYASGLPLALKVIGSHLAKKSVKGCENALKQYEKILDKKIQEILKISYDCLEDPAKCIFLDIACFFKWETLGYVEQGNDQIEGIMLDPPTQVDINWRGKAFKKMNKLRILIIQKTHFTQGPKFLPNSLRMLEWEGYPSKSLPSNFLPSNIVVLSLRSSHLTLEEAKPFPKLVHLTRFNFSGCQYITHFPDVSGVPNLSELDLSECRNLTAIHHSVGFLQNLNRLAASHCKKLKDLPPRMSLPSLQHLDLNHTSIASFPDVSGVPNLSELELKGCRSLTTIHHSVGFLQNLKHLTAHACTKLQDFPPRMSLPSLQHLDLSWTSIAFFPHIEERMCAPLKIYLIGCPIKGLPDSISNLVGLEMIYIDSKSVTAGGLPTELFMLPNIKTLDLHDCGDAVMESLKKLLNSHAMATTGRSTFNKPRHSPLRKLHCFNCGLTDEDLHIILCSFPNLKELSVPWNEFVSLPASIKGSAKLKRLDVIKCLALEEIPELPKSIKEVQADGCPCLSSEAFKMLWSQAFNEDCELQVVMPRLTEIPDWFDHHCKGGIVSFQARRKFPVLAIAFILEEHAWLKTVHLHINGVLYRSFRFPRSSKDFSTFNLRSFLSKLEWSCLDTFLVHEWNHVEIEIEWECECYYDRRCNVNNCSVSSCGAYVHKQETNMEDIRFTCPNSLKRTLSIVDDDSPKRRCSEEAQA